MNIGNDPAPLRRRKLEVITMNKHLLRSFARPIPVFLTLVLLTTPALSEVLIRKSDADRAIEAQERTEVLNALVKALRAEYLYPDVGEKMAQAIEARELKKGYDTVTTGNALAEILTRQVQEISHDKHLRINHSTGVLPRPHRPSEDELARQRELERRENYRFDKAEHLPGNVGLLSFRGFLVGQEAFDKAVAAMNFLADTDALIIDLRQNGGGAPDMVTLITSYLFQRPTHINDMYTRSEPDKLTQRWTMPYVPGKSFGQEKPVYILTSNRTFSAAEEFTFNLKTAKRAMTVGETTGGGAHFGGSLRLSDHFMMNMPRGETRAPWTKVTWEGVGIAPDLPCPQAQAFQVAYIDVLGKLIVASKDEAWKKQLQNIQDNLRQGLDRPKEVSPVPLPTPAPAATAADVSGKWSGNFTVTGPNNSAGDGSAFLILKQAGSEITGTGGPDENQQWPLAKVRNEGNNLTCEITSPDGIFFQISLTLDGDHLKGDVTVTAPNAVNMKGKMDLTRVK
jgi:hypothetical protein